MAQDPQGCGAFPRLQKRAVALCESKLVSWSLAAGRLTLRLDAYLHVSQGQPGFDAGTAWEQPVELVLTGVEVQRAPAEAPLWLTGGAISLDGGPGLALLPLPLEHAGVARLVLEGESDRLEAAGLGLTAKALGEPRFVERFAGER